MAVVHIVMFHFPASASEDVTKATLSAAEDLKTKCLHPITGKPYILSYKAGKDCSDEGAQDGITHTFVMEFENKEDRDYYVHNDPDHFVFMQNMSGKGFKKIQVTDFVVGEY